MLNAPIKPSPFTTTHVINAIRRKIQVFSLMINKEVPWTFLVEEEVTERRMKEVDRAFWTNRGDGKNWMQPPQDNGNLAGREPEYCFDEENIVSLFEARVSKEEKTEDVEESGAMLWRT